MPFRGPDSLLRQRIARAFVILQFDQSRFDPADTEPLRKHLRRLSFEMHPDRHPADAQAATKKYQEVQEAYNIIMDNVGRIRSFQETARPGRTGCGAGRRAEPGPPDYHIGRRVVDSLAREGKWSTIISCAKGRFRDSPDLVAYANSVLEKNVPYILETGQEGMLAYVFYNSAAKETKAGIVAWFFSQGKEDQARDMLQGLANLAEWDCLAHCASALREPLASYASMALEHNAAAAIAGNHEYSTLFLWKNARSEWVRSMAMDALARAGNPDAVKSMLEGLALGRDWKGFFSMAMGLELPNLRRFAVSLAEKSLEQALSAADAAALVFIWENASSGRIRLKIVDRLVEAGDFDSVEGLFRAMAGRRMWKEILNAYERLPPGNRAVRSSVESLMESNLPAVVVSGDPQAAAFIYSRSEDPRTRHILFSGLVGAGKTDAAIYLLERIAENGRWDELVEEAGESPLRKRALSLLEKNSRRVISSGQADAIRFLCRNTGSRGLVASALKTTGDEEILGMMAEKGMWKEIADCGRRTKGELRELSISLLEENLGSVLRGDAGVALFLFENARTRGVRDEMLGQLVAARDYAAVRPMLDLMARRRMWRGLAYCAGSVLAGHPELRRHALYLMEGDIRSVMESGSDEAVSFVSQNTRKRDVLDRIEGRARPGFFASLRQRVRDSMPRAV